MKKITFLMALFAVISMNAQIFSDDFNTEIVDATTFANWTSVDVDGDGNFWEVFDADGTGYLWTMTGLGVDSDSWEGSALSPDNYLITTNPIDLSLVTGTTIDFIVGTYQTNGTFLGDKYSVYLTTSNDPAIIATETPLLTRLISDDVTAAAGDGSDSAAPISIDASAYDGQVVYLTFRHYDTVDENSVLIDDVVVDGSLAVADETFNGFIYYVNQNSQLDLQANTPMSSVSIFNILGQMVITQKLSSTSEVISLSNLDSGLYIANVMIDGQMKSFKIVRR